MIRLKNLRVFVLPSWCPNNRAPNSGIFFLRQAEAVARLRPEWTVGIVLPDVLTSRFSFHWKDFKQFCTAFCTRMRLAISCSEGLHSYRVWRAWQRYVPFADDRDKMAEAMTVQARTALRAFTARHGQPHIIHAHVGVPGGTAAARLSAEYGIPAAITEHMGPFPWPEYRDEAGQPIAILREAYAGTRGHAAVSSSLARTMRDAGLADPVVIPNLVDERFFFPTPDRPGVGGRSLLSVGGPDVEKGTDTLLRAFAELEGGTLSIVGQNPGRPFYERLAEALGIADRVRWLGGVRPDDMPALYQACDAFVLPSRGETFGVSCVEALMCGKPVIATACGGPEDIVTDLNGLLVPVDDVSGLADALRHLCSTLSKYRPGTIREDAVRRFGTHAVVNKLEVLYRTVLG